MKMKEKTEAIVMELEFILFWKIAGMWILLENLSENSFWFLAILA